MPRSRVKKIALQFSTQQAQNLLRARRVKAKLYLREPRDERVLTSKFYVATLCITFIY